MLDPQSDAFVPVIVGALVLIFTLIPLTVFLVPRLRMRRLERRAAAGDPDAIRSMQFLRDLTNAFNAGSPDDLQRREALRTTGRKDRAVIRELDIGSTRVERGGRAMRPVTMTLMLLDQQRELSVTEYVDELYVARLLLGAEVPVFIDPSDRDALTVGWDIA